MKKQFILSVFGLLLIQSLAFSQWFPSNANPGTNIYRSGKVGVGFGSLSGVTDQLNVNGDLRVNDDIRGHRGNAQSFGIFGNTQQSNGSYIRLYGPNSGQITITSYDKGSIRFYNYKTGWKSLMQIKENGKIIMGGAATAPSGYLLSVDDGIITQQIKVCPSSSSWCDYVFENDYHRNTIPEVEKFVQKNKHLPNVPSAKEVGEEGLNVAEMDAILLRQIEELWLNMIDMDKELKALRKENDDLKNSLKTISNK